MCGYDVCIHIRLCQGPVIAKTAVKPVVVSQGFVYRHQHRLKGPKRTIGAMKPGLRVTVPYAFVGIHHL
jgi:hypothetical protein